MYTFLNRTSSFFLNYLVELVWTLSIVRALSFITLQLSEKKFDFFAENHKHLLETQTTKKPDVKMKFGNGSTEWNGDGVNVVNEKYKKCDIVGASFNSDVSVKRPFDNDDNSDNPYAELETYLENVKVIDHIFLFRLMIPHLRTDCSLFFCSIYKLYVSLQLCFTSAEYRGNFL